MAATAHLYVGSAERSHVGLLLAKGDLDEGARLAVGDVDGPIVAEEGAVSMGTAEGSSAFDAVPLPRRRSTGGVVRICLPGGRSGN